MDEANKALITITPTQRLEQLRRQLRDARADLRTAEAELGREQAAVNAFRMHCRLKLGDLVDEVLDLRTTKQRLSTRLSVLKQAREDGVPFDEDAWFAADEDDPTAAEEEAHSTGTPAEDAPSPPPDPTEQRRTEKRLYRDLARKFHPDRVEDSLMRSYATSMMAAVNDAYARRDLSALRDLAGELDPDTAAEIAGSGHFQNKEMRRLQKKIRKCRRRRRKVGARLKALRRENTAKLWHRAQHIEPEEGQNWWEEVAGILHEEIETTTAEVEQLHADIHALRTEMTAG